MFSARRVVGLGILAIALVGCARIHTTDRITPVPTPAGVPIQIGQITYVDWGEADTRGAKTREMNVGDSYFRGTFIRGLPGQKLTLKIHNDALQGHNFSLPTQRIDQDLPPGSPRVDVDITFPSSGGVQFFCKFHTAQGMNGMLLVGNTTPRSVAGS